MDTPPPGEPSHRQQWLLRLFRCHPVLFAIFPFFFVASQNTSKVCPASLVVPVIVVVIIMAASWWVLSRIGVPGERVSVLLTFCTIWFFAYRIVGNIPIGRSTILLIARVLCYLLLLGVGCYLVLRVRVPWGQADQVLTLIGATLCMLSAGGLFLSTAETVLYSPAGESLAGEEQVFHLNSVPDIYFIILDSYAGDEFLTRFYGYDNRPFLDGLSARGFVVVPESRSNYHSTLKTLASELNMEYIPENAPVEDISRLLGENRVMKALSTEGYQTYVILSGYSMIDRYIQADKKIDTGLIGEFGRAVLDMSIIGYPLNVHDKKIRTLVAIEKLEELAPVPGPKFVYAHIDSPHRPYVFERNGRVRLLAAPDTDTNAYLSELEYLNGRIMRTLDTVLAESPSPPVIILASDHGARLYGISGPLEGPNYLSNLQAIYLPPGIQGDIPRGMTPVNTFRVIFSLLSNETIPLLPDRSSLKGDWQEAILSGAGPLAGPSGGALRIVPLQTLQ